MRLRLFFAIFTLIIIFLIPGFNIPISEITVLSGSPNLLPDNTNHPAVEITNHQIYQNFNIHYISFWINETAETIARIITLLFGLITSGFIILLYTRRPLSENPKTRAMIILAYLKENPGTHQNKIIKATGFSRGSVSHNLRRLTRELKIYKTENGYYPIGIIEKNNPAWKLLENESRKRIFKTILQNPGISQKQIAEEIHIPVTTLRWHLDRMLKENLILVETSKHITRYSVHPSALC